MRFFRTDHQDYARESQRGSQTSARLRVLSERRACSPRAAVAFTTLAAVTWLREKAGGLARLMASNWNTTACQQAVAQTYMTARDIQGIEKPAREELR
jgi:hypothetical protein